MNLQDHLEEIEILIENELGMDRGELVKSLMEADRDKCFDLIHYYNLCIMRNQKSRSLHYTDGALVSLLQTIILLRSIGQEKQPPPSKTFEQYKERMVWSRH